MSAIQSNNAIAAKRYAVAFVPFDNFEARLL